MKNLIIDIETYSSVSLSDCGLYKYAEAPDFQLLLFSYSVDCGEVKVVDVASGESIPDEVLIALTEDSVLKWAHNAAFERICLSRYLGIPPGQYLSPQSWRCTMVWAATLDMPKSLRELGEILKIDQQKLETGSELVRFFCTPSGKDNSRNFPADFSNKWKQFKVYNKRDVEATLSVMARMNKYPVRKETWAEYVLDQQINDNGVLVDTQLATKAIDIFEQAQSKILSVMKQLTGLDNPNSEKQLKQWLNEHGCNTSSLTKSTVADLIPTASPKVVEVLKLRQQAAKSSIAKYRKMLEVACADNRARGMFMFYGSHTGRWSGKLIQLQNLPQNHIDNLTEARTEAKSLSTEGFILRYPEVSDVLSQLIRTAFVAPEGKKLLIADFSAIEARVLAWLAEESWRIKAFREGEDIYCASASKMFRVPVEKNGVNGHLRQKGKIAELALGYGGSIGALKNMGALSMGLAEQELDPLVYKWRESNPNIVSLWRKVNRSVINAIQNHSMLFINCVMIDCRGKMLFVTLPSGRNIAYVRPRVAAVAANYEKISYESVGTNNKRIRIDTYGAKLVENIVQGIARDCLAYAMQNLDKTGYKIIMHIHDEVVIEADQNEPLEKILKIMDQSPPWANGLQLRADGYESDYYKK